MLKRVVSVTILLACLFSACVVFARVTDSKGNAVNGKLEEYDRRVRGADSAGFAKNGSYTVDSGYRYELQDGLTDRDIREMEKGTPSLYFNKDGTPKKNTYSTDGDPAKRFDDAIKEGNREWWANAEASRQRRMEEERQRKERDKEMKTYFFLFFVAICLKVLLEQLVNKLIELYRRHFGKKFF